MDYHNHRFIVFCHEDHYNPLGAVRSLGEAGIAPTVVAFGGGVRVVSNSKYVKESYHVKTIEDGYKLMVDKFASNLCRPYIITCDDKTTQFLDERYDELKEAFILFNAGRNGGISCYMNKKNINEMARKHGIKIPDGYVVRRGEILDEFKYPVITKAITSNTGAWKKDVHICYSADELRRAYETIKSDTLLIQHYIKKENELCLDGCSVNKGKDVFYAIASNYDYIVPGEYSNEYTSYSFNDNKLRDSLNEMFEDIGFEGIFSVELLIDENGDYYFLEINFRNSTWSYTATSLGMNLMTIWAQGMLDGFIPENVSRDIPDGYKTLAEFTDFSLRVLKKRISLSEWIRNLKTIDCFLVFNRQDIKPFLLTLWDYTSSGIRYRIKKKKG